MSQTKPLPTKPVGVIASLAAGFDTVIQGWWILILPIVVDLFLWLGPHLSITPVATRALDNLVSLAGENLAIEPLLATVEELNYFSIFSVTPLGVPSLMSLKLPLVTPIGSPVVLSIGSELLWLTVFLGLSLCGLMAGGLYLGLIAQQVRDGKADLLRLLGVLPRYWISIVALIIILLLAVTILSIPVAVLAAILTAVSVWIATLVVWVSLMLFLWLLFHLFFTVHGMLLSDQPLFTAAWTSVRLMAFNSFSAMGLLALVLGIGTGLNYLWNLPQEDSWMLLVGIAGHSIITSGLVAATFVFYQDRFRYWQELREYLSQAAEAAVGKGSDD